MKCDRCGVEVLDEETVSIGEYRVCGNCKETTLQKLREGVPNASDRKERPVLVWVITCFYGFGFLSTMVSLALIYSGAVPLPDHQKE